MALTWRRVHSQHGGEVSKMRVLVVYGSKYGSTKGIAERIAGKLTETGHQSAAVPADSVGTLESYDAFVVGSAAYLGKWLKEPAEFVRRNTAILSTRPVWLFSSGPLGRESTDQQGRDLRETSVPKEIAEFKGSITPRDHHVFFGAADHTKFNIAHRLVFAMPAIRKVLMDGDFRDWKEIDGWAESIAEALTPVGVA
jgi:menaquinone-dependent protoporphyrinogen oxidase